MQRIIFESAPEFVLACILAGIGYGALQYWKSKGPWSKNVNRMLFALRSVIAAFVAFLLLGPIIKQITNRYEKPLMVLLQDQSLSIKEATDSVIRKQFEREIIQAKAMLEDNGYDVVLQNLTGEEITDFNYNGTTSDLHGALRQISDTYEGKEIAGIVLASDGVYNTGLSPLYGKYNFPVNTVVLGDTTIRTDISINDVAYNKIAYQGNKFPIRVEAQLKNINQPSISATLTHRGKVVERLSQKVNESGMVVFDFQPQASEQGIQRYDVQLEVHPSEQNTRNNRSSVYIEVVEGKKKILLVASAPHPDVKAFRELIEQNANYEFLLHIPGVTEQQASVLRPDKIDLAIFHQAPDLRGRTTALFQTFAKSKTSLLFILGQRSDLPALSREGMPLRFENTPRDYDEVTASVNSAFSSFSLSSETITMIANYPPVAVHYGKVILPGSALNLLFQRVGSVTTDKPLLSVQENDGRKVGIVFGDGLWRWRLYEFDRAEKTMAFDELFGKLAQFMSTTEDRRRFRSYPVKQEFNNTEAVVLESQVYNEIFEPVFGNRIDIEITDEQGTKTSYNYVTSPGNTRYQIGGLREGVYRYQASTMINNQRETVRGEFAVTEQQAELQNLTANAKLLQKLSEQTGGKAYFPSDAGKLFQALSTTEARSVIYSDERYDAIINLRWVFFLLLILVSLEWGLRKYHGSY